jgi:hypothetical protein
LYSKKEVHFCAILLKKFRVHNLQTRGKVAVEKVSFPKHDLWDPGIKTRSFLRGTGRNLPLSLSPKD